MSLMGNANQNCNATPPHISLYKWARTAGAARRGCGKRADPVPCWWERENRGDLPLNTKHTITVWPSNSTFGCAPGRTERRVLKEYLYTRVPSSATHAT